MPYLFTTTKNTYSLIFSTFKSKQQRQFDNSGFFIFVLIETAKYPEKLRQKIFEDCWNLHIINVIVLEENSKENEILAYTYFPFSPGNCDKVVVQQIYDNDNMFPNKLKNMHRCPLLVATYNLEPRMILKKFPNNSYNIDGIDGIILKALALQLNFTTIIKTPSDGYATKGTIYKNGTITGAIKMVYQNEVNFTIGEYSFNAFWSKYLGASSPYHYTTYILAVAKDRSYTSIEQLIFTFDDNVWYCTIAVFIIIIPIIIFLKCLVNRDKIIIEKNNSELYFNMLSIYLGNTIHNLSERNFLRTIFAFWMIGCVVLRNSYQGSLFQLFRTPKLIPSPNTLNDLVDENYRFFVRQSGILLFENMDKIESL